jgi:hypothetical protein
MIWSAALALALSPVVIPQSRADEYSYEPVEATTVITRDGKNLEPVSEYSATIQTRIDYVLTKHVQEPKQVQVLVCDQGNGSDGDWKNFFNVPKPQKPQALADAVLGIGLPTARKIVDLNLIDHKPRSWDEFKRLMQRIDDQYIKSGFSHEVIVTYGQQNMRNLGYDTGNCHYEWQTYYVWVEKKFVIGSQPASRDFRVVVEGSVLLNGESERLTLSFNGLEDSLKGVDSAFNRYQSYRTQENGLVTYHLQGQRIRATPPNHGSIHAERVGDRVGVTVVDPDFDADLPNAGRTVAVVDVWKKIFFWPDKKIGSFQLELTEGTGQTVSNVVPQAGSKVYATFRLQKIGSAYYSGDLSEKARSDGDLQF